MSEEELHKVTTTKCTTRKVGLRLVGHGSFGKFIESLLFKYPDRHNFVLLPPFTRSTGVDWRSEVLDSDATEAV